NIRKGSPLTLFSLVVLKLNLDSFFRPSHKSDLISHSPWVDKFITSFGFVSVTSTCSTPYFRKSAFFGEVTLFTTVGASVTPNWRFNCGSGFLLFKIPFLFFLLFWVNGEYRS